MAAGAHTHTLTNLNPQMDILDIDFIRWTSSIDPQKNGTLIQSMVDDADPAFSDVVDAQSTTPVHVVNFYRNTGHTTSRLGSEFNFTFALGGAKRK